MQTITTLVNPMYMRTVCPKCESTWLYLNDDGDMNCLMCGKIIYGKFGDATGAARKMQARRRQLSEAALTGWDRTLEEHKELSNAGWLDHHYNELVLSKREMARILHVHERAISEALTQAGIQNRNAIDTRRLQGSLNPGGRHHS